MLVLNFDDDVRAEVDEELRPTSPTFQSLPLFEQLRLLEPFLQKQNARDVKVLGPFLRDPRRGRRAEKSRSKATKAAKAA